MGREVFQQLECFKSCRLGFSISKDLCTTIAQTRDTQRKGPGHEMPLMLQGVKARAIGHDMPGLLQESLCDQSGVKAGLKAAMPGLLQLSLCYQSGIKAVLEAAMPGLLQESLWDQSRVKAGLPCQDCWKKARVTSQR